MKEDINTQINILVQATIESDKLNEYIKNKFDEIDSKVYSHFSIEETVAMLVNSNIAKISSGDATNEQELDLICCLLLLRAARRIKMSKRWHKEPSIEPGKCKNCKKDIEDDSSGFCPDANDKCWKERVDKQNKNKGIL
jgi:hypothetical protein